MSIGDSEKTLKYLISGTIKKPVPHRLTQFRIFSTVWVNQHCSGYIQLIFFHSSQHWTILTNDLLVKISIMSPKRLIKTNKKFLVDINTSLEDFQNTFNFTRNITS